MINIQKLGKYPYLEGQLTRYVEFNLEAKPSLKAKIKDFYIFISQNII